MIVKALVALSLPLASPSWSDAGVEYGIPTWRYPEVVRVDCAEGRGSAFRVGPNTLLSVNHVTSLHGCQINGRPVTVLGHKGDFSIIQTDEASSRFLHIDCGGFIAGKHYTAIGFARGVDTETTIDLDATGEDWNGFSRLIGMLTVIPGQSGGPIVDQQTGKVVGTVNVYNFERGDSGSVALRDTSVCAGATA